jgi:hypothetical protein
MRTAILFDENRLQWSSFKTDVHPDRETRGPQRADLVEEVAGYHQIYSRETTHLVEVPASQAAQRSRSRSREPIGRP